MSNFHVERAVRPTVDLIENFFLPTCVKLPDHAGTERKANLNLKRRVRPGQIFPVATPLREVRITQ